MELRSGQKKEKALSLLSRLNDKICLTSQLASAGDMKINSICFLFFLSFILFVPVTTTAQMAGSDLEKQAIQEAEKGNQAIALDLYSKAG